MLIELSSGHTLLVHMKMTGHLLYGTYQRNAKFKVQNAKVTHVKKPSDSESWRAVAPEILKDPFNQFLHFVISFENGKHLALSDMRKFAKVTLINTKTLYASEHLKHTGPEPLEKTFSFADFAARLAIASRGKIKQVLMDPTSLPASVTSIRMRYFGLQAYTHFRPSQKFLYRVSKNVPFNERGTRKGY